MGRSPLYKLQDRYVLTTTPAPGDPVFNPVTQEYDRPAAPGEPVIFEVHLEKTSRSVGQEQPGLEEGRILLRGQVVKTPTGTPLTFPAGVKAGDTFDLELFGTQGKLELLATPISQTPQERKVLGLEFEAVFKAVG